MLHWVNGEIAAIIDGQKREDKKQKVLNAHRSELVARINNSPKSDDGRDETKGLDAVD